jgi:hypothetical protein
VFVFYADIKNRAVVGIKIKEVEPLGAVKVYFLLKS